MSDLQRLQDVRRRLARKRHTRGQLRRQLRTLDIAILRLEIEAQEIDIEITRRELAYIPLYELNDKPAVLGGSRVVAVRSPDPSIAYSAPDASDCDDLPDPGQGGPSGYDSMSTTPPRPPSTDGSSCGGGRGYASA